jgi:hypothetical protein
MKNRCEECGKYLDGLTKDSERHPVYEEYCVKCGTEVVKFDGPWTMRDQYRREAELHGINPKRLKEGEASHKTDTDV